MMNLFIINTLSQDLGVLLFKDGKASTCQLKPGRNGPYSKDEVTAHAKSMEKKGLLLFLDLSGNKRFIF
jgi:hypothetical protein